MPSFEHGTIYSIFACIRFVQQKFRNIFTIMLDACMHKHCLFILYAPIRRTRDFPSFYPPYSTHIFPAFFLICSFYK